MPARTIAGELLPSERGFWTGGPDYDRHNLDDLCVTVFTEVADTFKRRKIAGLIREMDRWRELRLVRIYLWECCEHRRCRRSDPVITSCRQTGRSTYQCTRRKPPACRTNLFGRRGVTSSLRRCLANA
jgi:hypothetical protein